MYSKIWGVSYLKFIVRFEEFLLPVVEQPLQQVGHWQDKLATIILQLRLFLHFLQQSMKEFDHFIF